MIKRIFECGCGQAVHIIKIPDGKEEVTKECYGGAECMKCTSRGGQYLVMTASKPRKEKKWRKGYLPPKEVSRAEMIHRSFLWLKRVQMRQQSGMPISRIEQDRVRAVIHERTCTNIEKEPIPITDACRGVARELVADDRPDQKCEKKKNTKQKGEKKQSRKRASQHLPSLLAEMSTSPSGEVDGPATDVISLRKKIVRRVSRESQVRPAISRRYQQNRPSN